MGGNAVSVLSGEAIRQRLRSPILEKRLVISPILEEAEQLQDSNASVDVRLGCQFAFVSPSQFGSVDELDSETDEENKVALAKLYNKLYVPVGSYVNIHPHQFVLAQALEYLRLPDDLMAYVVGRSTWGRLGLTVATAIGVHPGYAGCLTLELRNLGETPLTLRPGQTIAQLFIHSALIGGPTSGVGQYRGSVDLIPRKMSSSKTRGKLKSLRTR
jgi:dCTP deaminase